MSEVTEINHCEDKEIFLTWLSMQHSFALTLAQEAIEKLSADEPAKALLSKRIEIMWDDWSKAEIPWNTD